MAISRRNLVRSLGAGALGSGALTACGEGGMRRGRGRGRPRPTTTAPTAEALEEPDTPLLIGSIGASYGRSAPFEKAIAIAVREAVIDVNHQYGKVFGHDLQLAERHVMAAPGEDLSSVIAGFADAGVTAVITSIDEDALVAAIPAFVEAGIAIIDVFSSGMSVRAPEVQSSGMLVRIAPNDRATAARYAEAAWSGSGDGTPGTVAFLSENTSQGQSLRHELEQILSPQGGRIVTEHLYTPGEFGDVAAVATTVLETPPALVVLNGGAEAGPFLAALHTANLDEGGRPVLQIPAELSPNATVSYLDSELPVECLTSAHGYEPGGELLDAHVNMMLNVNPDLLRTGYAYSQQAYDAVMLAALAAMHGLSVQGTDIAASIPSVLTGSEACEDFGSCRLILRDALSAGGRATVTFTGRTGPLELGSDADPRIGDLRIYAWSEANELLHENTTSYELPG